MNPVIEYHNLLAKEIDDVNAILGGDVRRMNLGPLADPDVQHDLDQMARLSGMVKDAKATYAKLQDKVGALLGPGFVWHNGRLYIIRKKKTVPGFQVVVNEQVNATGK